MSQTLTKPILLDETGQAIAGKLDTNSAAIIDALEDIKDAVSLGTDFVPVMIKVTTPPAKVSYMAGENLNLSGIVVSLIASNGVQVDVTEQCTFSPANGTPLTSSDTSVTISYYWYRDDVTFTTSYPIGVKSLSSIAITTPPAQTEYMVGDELDLTGIIVTATYDDGTFLDVTQNCTFNPADGSILTISDTSVTVTYTEGSTTKTATQALTVNAIYGVEWDGTATSALTRTDSASGFTDPVPYYSGMSETPSSPFDSIQPWSGMVKEERDGGTMVKIPKFYYKLTKSGNSLKVQISPLPVEGYNISPAHMDRGDGNGERDYVYVGRYHCSSNYKSVTGQMPINNITKATARTNIHNLGVNTWQWDFAVKFTLWLLYIVEFADWNSQAKIGCGGGTGNQYLQITEVGYTDSMPYHTGTTKTAKTIGGPSTQYRNIEGLWDNIKNFIDGMYSYNGTYFILNPNDFADYSGGIRATIRNTSSFVTKVVLSNEAGLFPMFVPDRAEGGTGDTYLCDGINMASSGQGFPTTGAYYYTGDQDPSSGMFFMKIENSANEPSNGVGCRSMELP